MSVIDFEYLRVTTMTVVMPMRGVINLDMIFPLLEITRLDLPIPKRQTQKYKIPYCGIPGAILSVRHKGYTRGIIKSQSTKYFKNSITIDMATSEKNVNLKLSRNKIHMCGARSVGLAQEASDLIIRKIYDIQDNLDYMNSHPNETQAVITWLKAATRGSVVAYQQHYIKIPDQIPETVDYRVALFLIKQAPDFMMYDDYCTQLDWVTTLTAVIMKPLEIVEIQKVMVNYNYDLGFDINRWALAQRINGFNGFISRYNNTVDHSVTIELPYELGPNMKNPRRKNKVPCHIFIVYKSGLVTQSGPNEELMRDAYNQFNQTINQIRPLIIKLGESRPLRFKPVRNRLPLIQHEALTQQVTA